MEFTKINIKADVNASPMKVWEYWTNPSHIVHWNQASEDWHCPKAENDLRVGGKFSSTMASKDGTMSFDFWGVYTKVENLERIDYTLGDGRKVEIHFSQQGDHHTHIDMTFEAEGTNSLEMQQNGWQAILNSFKSYAEGN